MAEKTAMFRWTGAEMVPSTEFMVSLCRQTFEPGTVYRMKVKEARSWTSHKHQFAWVRQAWMNLPERFDGQFKDETHLRRYALIQCGYYTQRQLACDSEEAAERVAAFLRPADEYAIVVVEGSIVTEYTAQSQSYKAMGKKRFHESKQAILEFIADMIGVAPEKLETEQEPA